MAGTTERTTFPFTNGIGVAASMTFVDMVSKGSVSGGLAFRNQPKVKVIDAGGNVLVGDSTSTVTVSIFDNPSGGHLLPLSNHPHILSAVVVSTPGGATWRSVWPGCVILEWVRPTGVH